MANKDFKVKNKLQVAGITSAGPIIADASGNLDSTPYIATQYGGTGTATSPSAGQILYSSSGTTYAPTNLSSVALASNSTYYIGTTQNVFNRASGAQTLTGVSIDGNAATVSNITRTIPATNDFNTLLTSGFYRLNSPLVNGPAGANDWGQCVVIYGGADTITQIYGDWNTGNLYTRSGNPSSVGGAGAWTNWTLLLDTDNYTSYISTYTSQSISSNITLSKNIKYFVDTTAARSLTLPASPSVGDELQIFDASNLAGTNNITVNPNGSKINGVVDTALLDYNGVAGIFVYTGSTYGWRAG